MHIERAIKQIDSIPDRWVRVEQLQRIAGGLELCLGVHKGRRGVRAERWVVQCKGVREASISDIDGGGLRLYPSSHPAARQYSARRAELRWPRSADEAKVLVALYRAHVMAVDDWIPFDRYLLIGPWNVTPERPLFAPVSGSNFVCRGPNFLLRAYAAGLENVGEKVRFREQARTRVKSDLPRVLHFGGSYIVAAQFDAKCLPGG